MTARVDFYVLKSATNAQRWRFACRLAEKAYLRDLKVVILNESPEDARALDDLLWTFHEHAFVPHDLCLDAAGIDAATPVHLALNTASLPAADLLVNLTNRIPMHWERFARIAEVIDADDERRRRGRERFKAYRDLKLEMQTHQLDEATEV